MVRTAPFRCLSDADRSRTRMTSSTTKRRRFLRRLALTWPGRRQQESRQKIGILKMGWIHEHGFIAKICKNALYLYYFFIIIIYILGWGLQPSSTFKKQKPLIYELLYITGCTPANRWVRIRMGSKPSMDHSMQIFGTNGCRPQKQGVNMIKSPNWLVV